MENQWWFSSDPILGAWIVFWNRLVGANGWSSYFLINSVIIGGVIGTVSTVWFMVGGIIDIRQLFKDLAARVDNPLDDGRVEGHVSLMDREALGAAADDDD